MKNEIETIEISETQLIKITNESGLEETKRKSYAQEFTPFTKLIDEVGKKLDSLNPENPSDSDVKIARALRLSLVPNRTEAARKKDNLKASMIIENRLIDSLFGVISNSSKLIENRLEQIEKHAEIKEKIRKSELKEKREKILGLYEVETNFYDLENMPDEAFNSLFEGIKKAHEEKIEAARIEEENRLAKIKADEDERIRLNAENERLKKEAQEKERLAEIERKKQEAERQKQEKLLQAEREKAAKEKQIADAKIEKERQEKIAAENQLKKEREEKARKEKEDQERLEAEKREKAEQARLEQLRIEEENEKRLSASDSEKINQLIKDIEALNIPIVSGRDNKNLIKEIKNDLSKITGKLYDAT